MGIDDLAAAVRWEGVGLRGIDWTAVEQRLGVHLPSIYKEYVERFPKGVFQDFLHILHPASADPEEFYRQVDLQSDLLAAFADDTPGFPYGVYPEVPGLFPWGHVGTDFLLCSLLYNRDNDGASTVLIAMGQPRVEHLGGTMVDCILGIITGGVPRLSYLADDSDPPRFDAIPSIARVSEPQSLPANYWEYLPNRTFTRLRSSYGTGDLKQLKSSAVATASPPDWVGIEASLGRRLPDDYKELIETSGPGLYGDIMVARPDGSEGSVPDLRLLMEDFRARAATNPMWRDVPLFPDPGGPFLWGRGPDNWWCGWLPSLYYQQPPLLFVNPSGGGQVMGNSLAEFLAAYLVSPRTSMVPWATNPRARRRQRGMHGGKT